MNSKPVVFFLVVAALCVGGCGKAGKGSGAAGRKCVCRCDTDANGLAVPRAPDAGLAPSRPTPARRAQHFTLMAAAKGYRSHRQCVASVHSILPPELTREGDPANLAERVCQTRRALAEKRPALCEEIDDAFWPRACRRLYAALYGKPDECPPREVRSRGRDELCVALATRDPGLCRAVRSAGGRLRCAAILGNANLCRGMRTTSEVSSCQLDRKRWRAVLRPSKATLAPKYKPRYDLVVTTPAKTLRGVSAALDQGVVVPRAGAAGRWILGGLRPTGLRSGLERSLLLMADLPPPGKVPATIGVGAGKRGARFCALWKGRAVAPAQIQGTVKITGYTAGRGARVMGFFSVKIARGNVTVTVRGTFDTFVRDVVPGAWARRTCADRLAEVSPAQPAAKATAVPVEPGERPCSFVAHWQGLRQVGYRVYGVRPGAACAGLGLKNGDVVLAVGPRARSKPLARWADVVNLYGLLAGRKLLVVRVLRRKRKITLKRAAR